MGWDGMAKVRGDGGGNGNLYIFFFFPFLSFPFFNISHSHKSQSISIGSLEKVHQVLADFSEAGEGLSNRMYVLVVDAEYSHCKYTLLLS